MPPKTTLGKGLGAIFPDILENIEERKPFILCGIEELIPNRFQARKVFDSKDLEELAVSIRESGIIQPIVARKAEGGYEIIAGERRWRAAQAAGLKEVPIIVREATDQDVALVSVVENLQRADLNPIEEGTAYYNLMNSFGLSQEEVAEKVGKDRSTVANMVRLLRLPQDIKDALATKKLSAGHARVLLSLNTESEQVEVYNLVRKKGLTVRETEVLVRRFKSSPRPATVKAKKNEILDLEEKLSKALMTRVLVKPAKKGGSIEIRFHSSKDLDRLVGLILEKGEALNHL